MTNETKGSISLCATSLGLKVVPSHKMTSFICFTWVLQRRRLCVYRLLILSRVQGKCRSGCTSQQGRTFIFLFSCVSAVSFLLVFVFSLIVASSTSLHLHIFPYNPPPRTSHRITSHPIHQSDPDILPVPLWLAPTDARKQNADN